MLSSIRSSPYWWQASSKRSKIQSIGETRSYSARKKVTGVMAICHQAWHLERMGQAGDEVHEKAGRPSSLTLNSKNELAAYVAEGVYNVKAHDFVKKVHQMQIEDAFGHVVNAFGHVGCRFIFAVRCQRWWSPCSLVHFVPRFNTLDPFSQGVRLDGILPWHLLLFSSPSKTLFDSPIFSYGVNLASLARHLPSLRRRPYAGEHTMLIGSDGCCKKLTLQLSKL